MQTNGPVKPIKTKEALAKQLFIEADDFLAAGYGEVLDARKAALKSGEIAPSRTPLETETVFHFSHERRMERVSKGVQELHRTTAAPSRGRAFSPFLGTRSNVAMIVVILLVAAVIALITAYTRRMGVSLLEGNELTFRAEQMNHGIMLTINKTVDMDRLNAVTDGDVTESDLDAMAAGASNTRPQTAYTGPVSVAVGPVPRRNTAPSPDTPVVAERIFFTVTPKETYRIFIPYEVSTLLVLMQTEKDQLTVTVKPR